MKLFLSLQLVVLALLAPSSCTSDWDLPRCSSQGCYGYDESWELTMATKAGGIQYIAINGAWSVDPIIVSKGDRIRIKVINKLSEDVTVSNRMTFRLPTCLMAVVAFPWNLAEEHVYSPGRAARYHPKVSVCSSQSSLVSSLQISVAYSQERASPMTSRQARRVATGYTLTHLVNTQKG